jgi:hypothetical protein
MTDFDALLKRSFAEAPEPVDDGFTVNVARGVERHENALKLRGAFQIAGVTIACGALAYGAYAVLGAFGQEVMATAGLEVARAHGAISNAPSVATATQGVLQSLSAGMSQILLITAVLAGGAVAYRATQD